MLNISSKMKKILTTIISLIALVGIGVATNMVVTNNNTQLNSKAHKAPSIEERRAINGTVNVTFDAYFLNNSERTNEALLGPIVGPEIRNIPTKDIYMELSVRGDGHLKDGKILIKPTNSSVRTTLVSDNVINGVYIGETSEIKLKNIQSGTTRVIKGIVVPKVSNKEDFFKNDNKVTFKATYVSADGQETPIEKTVNFTVETMYEYIKASSYPEESLRNQKYEYTKNSKPYAYFYIINTGEQFTKNISNTSAYLNNTLKEFEYRAQIPKFNGYNAEEVTANFYGDGEEKNITTSYDKNSGEFVIKYKGFNRYKKVTAISVKYPEESKENNPSEQLSLNATLTISAYNNEKYNKLEYRTTSEGKARIEYRELVENNNYYSPTYVAFQSVPYADNTIDLYEGSTTAPKKQEYRVVWQPHSKEETTAEVELTEDKSVYGDKLYSPIIDISNIVTHKAITMSVSNNNLNEDSTVTVYDDETNELIHTFNKNEIIEYSNKEYRYTRPIKHVKVVLNNIKVNRNYGIIIKHLKEIDDSELIKLTTKEEFEKLSRITTTYQQKINNETVTSRTQEVYYQRKIPSVGTYIFDRVKINEQAAYNNEQADVDNDFIYRMGITSTHSTKEIRVVDEEGVLLGNNKIKADNYIKYKGLYFLKNYNLKNNFNLKIYDNDTNQLIASFSKSDVERINRKEDAFIYPEYIKHIRLETNDSVDIEHIMNINTEELVRNIDINKYYNEIQSLTINAKYARIVNDGQEYSNFKERTASNKLYLQYSIGSGTTNKAISTYQKQKDVNQTIRLSSIYNYSLSNTATGRNGWKNATVLIEYPEDVKRIDINKITSNIENVEILGHDKFELDGKQYLKIYIKSNKVLDAHYININANITVDPLAKSKTTVATMYFYNSYPAELSQYYYSTKDKFDINNNGDTNDMVGTGTIPITIVSPDTLVLTQEITGYNTKNETAYAPGTGVIESNGSGTATVKIQLANYWTPSVSDIKLIGKIPFRNNITSLSKQTLKSTFSTTMTNEGIQLPEDLKNTAKVYYSELEDPSMNESNIWKTADQITNWNNIKSFYIDFGNKVLGPDEKKTITYKINVPLDVPVNEKTYSTVAGTFNLNTEHDGNLSSTVESNKVGIQLVKRYNLNIASIIKGKETPVQGSLYSVENNEDDEDLAISKTAITDKLGNAIVKELRVNEEYTLTEKSVDKNFEEKNVKIKFKLVEQNGRLELQVYEGNEYIKEKSEVQPTATSNAVVNIKLEYLKKYKLTINKKSQATKENIKNVGYKLSGRETDNKQYGNTDENGNLTFEGLRTNVIYTLTETVAPMHYIHPEIQFKVTETNGVPNIEVIKGNPESLTISETTEKQNQANISIFDEKVKTYTLKIVKYEKGDINKRLAHAQFSIKGDGILNGKVLETDENGEATITGLYEYKEGQEYKGEYTIEEIVNPEGYTGSYKISSKIKRNEQNVAVVYATTTDLEIKNAETDHPTVYFYVPNEPLFKIIKRDAKTSELLPNTKFAIVKVDESGRESEALDINNNPVGNREEIDGKTYRTILTNDKGEYSAGLKKGIYKFIELEASNDKYELPEREEDRTYTVNVGEPTKAKYKFVEDKNLEKIPEVTNPYSETVGLRRTFVNGKVIHYTLKKDKTDKIGNNRILTIYDNEFNVKKEVTFDSGDNYSIPEINIGKDGSIYSYIPKYGIRKYSPDGRFISQVGDYFGFARFQYNTLLWDMGAFGNSLFDSDTKSIPFQNPVVKNDDASVLLEEAYNAKRKPSMKNGVLSIDYSNQSQTVLTVYDNELNILSKINVDTDKERDSMYRQNTFDQVYDDYEGNIYVNNIKTNNIDVYDRSGTLKRSIERKGEDFTVLPDGKIYFFKKLQEGKGETPVEVTVIDQEGNEIANTTLARVRYYERFKHINVTADGSIEYSDTYNTEVINKKVDLKLETPAQPPQSEIVVENKLKKFKITTSSSIGGNISGKGENPYEEVEINSDSNKPIEIKADEGYVIAKIVINGEEYPISDEHNITLPKFNNITEDKNINVVFDLASNVARYKIQTFHYLKGTNTEVAPTVINYYNERENTYITEPKILEKYELEKNEQGEYIIPTNATGDAIVANRIGNNSVIYHYVKKKAKVITKYIVEKSDGSTEEIKPKDEQTLEVDSEYRTSGEINNPKYELIRIDGNARGTVESTEDINVTYVYKLKDAKVNVKYLDVTESETGTPLSSRNGTTIEDKVINGQVDDAYRTQEAENVQPNYSLVETPRNASGTMTIDPITVVYKYRKVAPTINDINVTKVGPNKIVSKNQLNTYNITFNVDISNYIGSGKVRLTDKLPYEIHYEDIDKLATGLFLDGGIYNNETKEIIWDIPITDINTYKLADERNENNVVITQNGNSAHITINKTISIRYKDLPNYNQGEEPKIENSIFGKVILDRNNEREVNSKYNSPANYNTAITVKKKWNDNSNSAEKRPTSITFALYKTINGQETKVKDYTLTGNKTTNDGWETKIEQLPIYDGVTQSREIGLERAGELGNRITYRVEETTNNKFYQSVATTPLENEFLLTNTFTVPDEKIEVQVNKAWDDNSNANAKRPTSIKYVLNGGKTPVEQVVTGNTTTNDGWGYKFTNLAKYDDLGNEITYTVSEQEATTDGLKFYTNRVSGEYKTGITITNAFTVPDNKVEVIASKQWRDDSNVNGKRPLSIKYVLNGGKTPVEQVVSGNRTTDRDWAYTFTNLPKYDAQGNEISYSVDEEEVNPGDLKFYTKSKLKNRMINTFTVPDEKINVPVTKHWEDGNNANGKRPASIKYVLTGNGTTKEQVVTGNATSDADWNYTFTNLPKYDAQGNEIAYTVEEQEVNANDLKFYAKSKANYDLTNTFKVPNEKIEVSVTKHWEDNSNANGKRPASVKYILTGNGLTKEQIVTGNRATDDNWSYTFTDLPKYNNQGNEIVYTVDEQEANTNGLKFYQKSIRGSNIINTFTVPDDKIEVAVTKVWNDSNNANGKRPTSVKYIVSGNGLNKEQVVTGNAATDANWNYTFTNLPKYDAQGNEIVYTIDEQEVNAGDFKFYTKQVTGLNVTNTFTVPDDKITIKIVKTWQDNENEHGKRPTSIKYILKGGKTEQEKEVTGNRTTTDGWEYVFTDLPKYNEVGEEYRYKIEEEITENAHLYQKQISSSILDDERVKFDVLNTFEVPNEKIEVPVTKHWEDNSNANGKRPASIKYVLKGGAAPVEKVVSGNTTTDENWGYTFTDLPKYNQAGDLIRYTIEEQEVNANDLKFYTKSIRGYDVTNTFSVPDEKIEVQVNKTWVDDNNANAKRPASVKYVLSGNGQTQEKVVTGNTSTNDNWSYKFTDLPKYNDQGNVIDYSIDEQEVNPGDFKFYTKSVRGFNVTNTFTVPDEKIEVQVNKNWVDDNNANSKRPASIKYVLSGNGLTKEQVVTGNTSTNDKWSYKFTDLPKYNNQGNEIVYTVDEQEVNPGDFKFYTKSIRGFDVTNTFTVPDEKIEVQVNKTWTDDNNANAKRPTSIKYVLSGNGVNKEQVVTGNSTSNENWSYKFTDLPKYNAQGNEIVYTLDEQEVSPNDLKFYEKSIRGFDVTNTFKVPDEKIELTATKTWNDDSNKNGKRPASIKYVLSGNGVNKEQVVTGNSTTNEDWSYKFTDLPKYNAQGNEISYTLDEQEVNTNDLKFYTKQIAGLNITNTFTVPDEKIEVQVNKVWDDNSNANAKRPTSIKYVLSGNGQTQEQAVTGNTSTNEDWSYKFTNLAKYNAQGNEISYTVSEKEVSTDDLKFYTNEITGDYKAGINIKNKFTVPDNKVEVTITKTWVDNSNANGKRPISIKYVLSGNNQTQEQVVTGNAATNADWNYTFTNLPKYNNQGNVINYSVQEQELNPNDLKFYSKEVNGFNITNTFKVPGDKVSVKVTKHWEDDSNANSKRPTSIKYILKGGKEEKTQTVTGNRTTDANWNYTFTELPKYDENGQEYQYSVEEEIIENAHLYTKAITSNTTNEFNVVNTFKVPADTINIPVTKHWEDDSNANGKRPASIKYILKGGATEVEQVVTGNTTTDADWNYTFANQVKYNSQGDEIRYTVEEKEVNENDLKFYTKSITDFNITNTFTVPDEKVEATVTKTWVDNNNANGKRPASIKYVLSGNGLTKEQVVTGNSTTDADWNYTFTNLPKYNAQGNEISYTVDEQEVNTDDFKFYTKQITGLNVTNTFTVPSDKVSVKVTKTWSDNSNEKGKRPASIKYILKGGATETVQVVTGNTSTDADWSYTFTDLPKYNENGQEYQYSVEEEITENAYLYQKAITKDKTNEFTVVNTFKVPEDKVTPRVTVTWEDGSNVNGKRPNNVKVIVKDKEGKTVKEATVTGNPTDDEWNKVFENVPKYDKNGDPIPYTVEEQPNTPDGLKFYKVTVSGDIDQGFKVTNKFEVPNDKIELTVNKTWSDDNNVNGKRPVSIKYVLTGNGLTKEQVVTGNTSTNEDWSYKFTELPKYNAQGNEIVYTVDEQEVNAGDFKFYTKQVAGLNITNTFTVPNDKIELTVNKTWVDDNNANGKRPTSIKYVLTGNGLTKEQVVTGNTSTNEDWSYKFTELPKYNAQGNEISYTLEEQEVATNDLKFYAKEVTGLNVTNTFKVPADTIEVSVNKHWDDNSNANAKRPASIKYVLSGNNQTQEQVVTGNANSDADWNYTFTNLPKYNTQGNEIIYTLEEQEVNANELKFYAKDVNGNYKNGFNLVNTFKVPADTVEAAVTKTWVDDNNANGKRPASIKYVLSGNNQTKEQVVTGNTNSDADWNYTFANLPKYDAQGNEIVYTVDEQEVNPGDFKFYTKQVAGLNVTNTFTVPNDKIEVQVNKVWEDNSNANAKRPASIKYVLSGNGLTKEQVVTGNTSTNEDWSYKFTDLPKYNAQGNEIVYTVAEQEAATDGLKFYTNEISGEYKTAITVKNKFTVPEDKVEVEVTKHWEDNNNANHRRPTSIKYVLKGNGLTKEQEVIGNATTDAGWNYKFTNLPKYNAQGNEVAYTVEEQEVNANDLKFYTKEVNGFNVTNTFKVPEDKINVTATKTWVDSSNAKGKRPASIKYILKGGKEEKTQVVSGNNATDENWSYTFENLAKYDSNGQEYQYSVEEEITENAHLYTKVITGNKESGFNVINTFKVPEDKLTIAVTKEWNDNSNVASKRPASIKYVLKGGSTPIEEVVSGNNTTDADWSHTFTNVAKYNDSGDEITYTLEEQEVSANDFKFYKKAISGDYKAGFNVANTFEVPDEKVEVQVNKVWEDDSNANSKRPASIKYILKGGAAPVEQVVSGNANSNADWSYKFTNLPKYSATGDEIQYTVEEQEVNTDELKFYEKEITGSMNAGFNVKNKFKVPDEKVEAQITKTWEDNSNVNGKRPASIKYILKGGASDKEQVLSGNTTTNDNWSYTFANLPKYNAQGNEITYTVEEQEVNPGDLKFYNKQIVGFNVTNTFRIPDDKVKVEITKKWEDDSNVSSKRPASVKIELSDGANVVRTQELTGTGNEWKYTFTDLPKYNSQGNTITYTLEEKEVNPGDLQFYTKSIVGNTITNTFTQSTDKINVNVSKTWNDSNNANRKRPVSIKYVLKNKETVVSEKVVAGNETTDADWTHTFTGLAKYDEHNDEIKYTLEEQEANEGELKFYTKQVNGDYKVGFNVVNTFKVPDERINVRVSKTWNDDSNSRSKRPTSIKYIITDGQNTVEQIVTGESNTDTNWSYEFSNLVKYEANTGNEISYTVREEEVNPGDLKFYEPTISGDYKAGINVTNKFVVPNDKVTPRVTITWEDNNNNGNKRPSNVKIVVKDKEGKVVTEGNVTGNPTDEEWNKVFENVPKYDKNGDPIPYTVEEKPNSPDDFKFYKITVTGDIDKGYKVTNKFEVPDEKVTVKVKKVWEDSNNAASKRPTAIKVQLKNNAAIVREERVTGSGNEWKYTFENVAKYNGYGDVINYTVEEIEEQTEDLKFYEKKITGDKDSEYVITNKFKVPDEKIEINVNKTWEDNNNAANKRPQSIKYILKGGAAEVEQVLSGNRTTDANWNYTFTNLAKYNAQGNEITYTLEEQEVNANDLKFYTKKVSGEQTNGFAVVNKFTVPSEKVTVKVSKTWDDESNRANKRPASIKYEVLNSNNQIVASKVQSGNKNTADGWSHNFELDKYDALGNEEVYNVQEVEVNQNDFKFYKATVSGNYKSGFTVTNKFEVPNEEVTPKISVEWKDNSNQNNKRPTSVKIQVKDEEGRIVKESPVTGLITEESWKKIFENVPKYNKNGNPINYTITEEPNNPNDLEFYTTTTSGNITNGFKVVNTYAVPGTTISLKANKKWLDGNNAKNKRPESIKIEVRNNNEVVADKEVKGNRTTDANWEVEFKNLPKYNPTTGAENVYTVTETEVHQGELRYYTSAVNGNTITNTIKPVTEGKIEDSKVEKESTLAKITKADEIVPYTITYKGKIKEYMGDAVVKIVDELPFKLDLSKSNIMDGSYDDESKTITWTENLNNIDTHSNGDKEVEIKKEIKLVYKDLKISEDNLKVTNKVRAEISLKELNKKITENNTKEIPAEISSKVTVKYVLKSNKSMKLKEDKVIIGHVGDAYQTTIPNDIDQDAYEFVEVEGNENGKISQEEKVVTYLYKKKFGRVVVSYVEKSTGMKLQNDEVIKGNINEPYNAEGKEIEYYNLVSTEKSENAKPVITEEEQKITHYYEKKVFNIEIDKELKEATIDGEKRTFRNGKFTKLDIPVKKILNSEVKVRYSINVRNTGEIKGSTVVQENIPKYFTMNPTENPDWRIENGKIVSKEIELNPGESKELSITLKWTNSKDNFGTLVNKAGIEKTKNNAGFEETDTEEEKKGKKQQATLVLVPKTGLDINKLLQMTGVGITLTALVAAMGYTISRKVRDEYINQ